MKKHDLFLRNAQIVAYWQIHPELTAHEIGKEFKISSYRVSDIIKDFNRNYNANILKYVCLKMQELYEPREITGATKSSKVCRTSG